MLFKLKVTKRDGDLTLFGRSVYIAWPYRFPYHPTSHGPNCTPKLVTRPELNVVRCSSFEKSTMKHWNVWLYFPSRTYFAGFGFGRRPAERQ